MQKTESSGQRSGETADGELYSGRHIIEDKVSVYRCIGVTEKRVFRNLEYKSLRTLEL
ncbi:MAG: hypothetical protein R6V04_11415 [bacterium]